MGTIAQTDENNKQMNKGESGIPKKKKGIQVTVHCEINQPDCLKFMTLEYLS